MNEDLLLRQRSRTHAIVEGALLGDIALVFLLMRAYLPILFVRPIIAAVAAVPFAMLTQRRGIKVTILAGIASYILFAALVGPFLAVAAGNVALAGLLVGLGRRVGFHAGLNTLIVGPIYGFVDLVIPAVASVIIFRYPVHDLVKSAQNAVNTTFRFADYVITRFGAPASAHHQLHSWQTAAVAHWQIVYLCVLLLSGMLTIYLAALVADIVFSQIPEHTLSAQGTDGD
jgi:hypothetical protein